MAKRKADTDNLGSLPATNSSKKIKASSSAVEKKANLLDDSDSGSSSDESDGGAQIEFDVGEPEFQVNQEYAKRFEYNKKREERQRLEEKYQNVPKKNGNPYGDKYDEDSESSDDEEEDDDGILATEELDAQISNALNAIRNKDPSVYKTDVLFYTPIENEEDPKVEASKEKKQKPMYLSDYHRENLLKGHTEAGEEENEAPRTFVQEQDELQRKIVEEMHAAVDGSDDEGDGFLVAKSKPLPVSQGMHPSRAAKVNVNLDIASADKNPETFLSNFMAARAWVPSDGARFQPLESDDDEEDERAEKFEEAYNLRFEDEKGSNEKLKSFARDIIAAKSVRREEATGRKKQRDNLREKREAERQTQDEERAQLRRLRIEEAEEKLKKIKKAAGLRGKTLKSEEWVAFLDDGWDDEKWETEMNKRFGEDYYAELEAKSDDDDNEAGKKSSKVKKPKWDDDIDIQDLIPEFDEDVSQKPKFSLSDDSEPGDETDDQNGVPKKSKTSKERQQEKLAKRKTARLERQKLEELVDSKMDLDLPSKSKQPTRFRYRETSPTSFGLTARDILMAPDASLNEFAGLKKMATFRDAEKKRKDKKKLGKKARLRQWRKETFGNEDGPEIVVLNTDASISADKAVEDGEGEGEGGNIVKGARKKKRSRKNKGVVESVD